MIAYYSKLFPKISSQGNLLLNFVITFLKYQNKINLSFVYLFVICYFIFVLIVTVRYLGEKMDLHCLRFIDLSIMISHFLSIFFFDQSTNIVNRVLFQYSKKDNDKSIIL